MVVAVSKNAQVVVGYLVADKPLLFVGALSCYKDAQARAKGA
jgi:hypothetical protein